MAIELSPDRRRSRRTTELSSGSIERRTLLVFGDLASILATAFVWNWPPSNNDVYTILGSAFVTAALWFVVAPAFDAYEPRVAARSRPSVLAAGRSICVVGLLLLLGFDSWGFPIRRPGSILALCVWLATSGSIRAALARTLALPRFRIRTLVTALGRDDAMETISSLQHAGGSDYWFVGCSWSGAAATEAPVLGAVVVARDRLPQECQSLGVQLAISSSSGIYAGEYSEQLLRLYESGVRVRQFSDLFEELTGRIPVRHLGSSWILTLPSEPGGGRFYSSVRRAVDIAVAASALLIVAPLLPLVALAIRLDSPGAAIYRQPRVGYLGRTFVALKFRTMRADAEEGGPSWTVPGDPRRTRLGRVLRPLRIDEIPQLWNVFKGEMTLIGPRPERPDFVERLEKSIPFYRARLLVRPGLTGWAQVRYPYADSVESSLEKLQYDLYYVKHRSVFLDLVVAVKTFGVVLRASGR